MSNFMGLMVIF